MVRSRSRLVAVALVVGISAAACYKAYQRFRLSNRRGDEDYRELLANPEIDAVVIALPLNLHAPVAIEAMRAGKHVLCEKLMARNIRECKEMIRVANETDRVLSIGHQRHYSLLYAHAVEIINAGVLGDVSPSSM